MAEARLGDLMGALRDFRQARFLEPNFAGLPYDEGFFWLGVAPRFALDAWQEALRRMPADRQPVQFGSMLAQAYPKRDLRDGYRPRETA